MADRILNGQQEKFLSYYTDPKSESFANAYRSALKAGYSEEYSQTVSVMPNSRRDKYIYVVKSGDWYKIGYSFCPSKRLESFKTCNPHGVELLHSVRLHGAKDMERKIHEVLKAGSGIESYREWYKLTPDQLATMIAGLNAVSLSIWKTN